MKVREKTVDEACADYLKGQKGTERLVRGMRSRYESLNGIAGNFILRNPTEDEKGFLRGLFKKDYSRVGQISISLKKFEAAFYGTRYEGISLKQVLESYFGEPMLSNKERSEKALRIRSVFWEKALAELENRCFAEWLTATVDESGSRHQSWFNKLHSSDAEQLGISIRHLDRIVDILEEEALWARPVLAAKATKDPHALDDDRLLYRMLLVYLSDTLEMPFPENAAGRAALAEQSGIVMDGSHLTVATYGLAADGRGGASLGWEGFHRRKEPLVLTKANLKEAEVVRCNVKGPVFAFENPAVFHTFIQQLPEYSAICTSGQVNQAVLKLLEALEKSGTSVLYNGDFDPEGLLIAQRLSVQFNNIVPWCYTAKLYEKAKSEIQISERRLKQLGDVNHPMLEAVSADIVKFEKAGYQEYIVEDLINEGKRHLLE